MPHFLHEALLRTLADSMYMNGHHGAHGRLQVMELNEQKVEELLHFLIFVWSPRILDRIGRKTDKK